MVYRGFNIIVPLSVLSVQTRNQHDSIIFQVVSISKVLNQRIKLQNKVTYTTKHKNNRHKHRRQANVGGSPDPWATSTKCHNV